MNIIRSLYEFSIIKEKHEADLKCIEIMKTDNDFMFRIILEVLKRREWDLLYDVMHYLVNKGPVERFLAEQYQYITAINEGTLNFATMSILDRRSTMYSLYQSGLLPERILYYI